MISEIPLLYLTPPVEDPDGSLCLISVQDEIFGLDNPNQSSIVSCFNSLCQLFINLEEITASLPIYHRDVFVTTFTNLVYGMHMGKLPNSDRSTDYKRSGDCFEVKKSAGFSTLTASFLKFEQNSLVCNLVSACYNIILAKILLKTRFSQHVLQTGINQRPGCISLALRYHSISKYTAFDLKSLLDHEFSKQELLDTLPGCLLIYINRECNENRIIDNRLHFKLELDMNRYVRPDYIQCKAQYGMESIERPTCYELHGFVTQRDGQFMTYTRMQNGRTWYFIQDSVVKKVEFAMNIESAGVCILLYRLQPAVDR